MNEELVRCYEADRTYATEVEATIFIRTAEEPEVELFNKIGALPGERPRTLHIIVAKNARAFVSAPRDVAVPAYTKRAVKPHPANCRR